MGGLLLLASPGRGAGILVPGRNLVLGTPAGAATGGASEVNYNQWLATSFTSSDSAPAVVAEGVSLWIQYLQPNQHYMVAITGNKAGRPDMEDIRAVADTTPAYWGTAQGTTQAVDFKFRTDGSSKELLPGERYWLVFGATQPDHDSPYPNGLYRWSYLDAPVPEAWLDGWSVSNLTATANTAGQVWSPELNTAHAFSLSLVEMIPEPGLSGLLTAAGWILLCRRRR